MGEEQTALTVKCPEGRVGCTRVIPFKGKQHPMSNFFPCRLTVDGLQFCCSEAAYQHKKAVMYGRPDVARKIYKAQDGPAAKRAAKTLGQKTCPMWEERKLSTMEHILEAKFLGCVQFRRALQSSGRQILGEATENSFWATGLSPEATDITEPEFWPGQNRLGRLLMALRYRHFFI